MSHEDLGSECLDSRQKEVDRQATKIFEEVAQRFNERNESGEIFSVAVFRKILDRHFDSKAEGMERAVEEARKRTVTKFLVEVLDSAFPNPSPALIGIRAVIAEYVIEEEERFKASLKKCFDAFAKGPLSDKSLEPLREGEGVEE